MGKLSPPTLQPTITTCSNELRVSGCVPGAHVIVFDEQRVIAELASAPSDTVYIPIIATALPLKAGSKLATRQEILPNLAGDSSKFDRQVTVADPPTPPVPRFVVLHCARCVRVLGMTVGHTVIVRMNSVPIGSALAFDSEVDVSLTAGAAATMTFEAVDCKVGPPPVAQALLYIPEDPGPLPAPIVGEPLRDCATRVPVSGLIPGAFVALSRTNQPTVKACATATSGNFVVEPLNAPEMVWASQFMDPCSNVRVKPSDLSNEAEVSGEPPNAPTVLPPCPGGDVTVFGLTKGAIVTLWRGSNPDNAYTKAATFENDVFKAIDPPLKEGEHLYATQALCATKPSAQSPHVMVQELGGQVGPISIPMPIYEGALVIRVEGIQVGGSLTLTSKHGLGIIAGVDPTMGPAVDVYPSAQIKFHGGTEEITAVFSICGKDYPVTRKVEKLPSDEFGGLPAPSVTYATACGGFARVENVLPGALVTLFANGTAIAKQPCPLRAARIEAPLDAGDVVHARQQIGGRSSLFGSGAIAQGGPNGEWYYAGKLDILPVHSALLHDPTDPRKARVLLFSGSQHDFRTHLYGRKDKAAHPNDPDYDPPDWNHTRIWYPEDDSYTPVPSGLPYDVFCAGHALLGSGNLLVAGGSRDYYVEAGGGGHTNHYTGLRDSTIFDAATLRWSAPIQMNRDATNNPESGGRWYPTLLTLSDGSVMAFAGHPDRSQLVKFQSFLLPAHTNDFVERFTEAAKEWLVTSTNVFGINSRFAVPDSLWYPRMFLLPDLTQRIATFGTTGGDGAQASWISTETKIGFFRVEADFTDYVLDANARTAVLLPLRAAADFHARVLYVAASKGGPLVPLVIDFGTRSTPLTPPGVSESTGMTYPDRQYGMATLLADGTVLVHGGIANNAKAEQGNARTVAELFNPATATWTLLPDSTIPRNYHSVSLLLVDGSVLVAGSNINRAYSEWIAKAEENAQLPTPTTPDNKDDWRDLGDTRELRVQRFYPPYMCIRPRPALGSAPSYVKYFSQFKIQTPDVKLVAKVMMLRHGSSTHAMDFDQRCIELAVPSSSPGQLTVAAPPDGFTAPPGYYTLFLVGTNGSVSSPGWVVRLGV